SLDPNLLPGGQHASDSTINLPLKPSEAGNNGWLNPWDPLFLSYIVNAPAQLADGWPHHLQQRFYGAKINRANWHFVDHHLSHAASAFLVAPYKDAAVMTIDGRGEKATTS